MATITYSLRGKSENEPIYLRLSAGRGNTPRRKTGLYINPKDWSSTTNFPKQNDANNKELKSTLEKLKMFVSDSYNSEYAKGAIINGEWLTEKIELHFKQGASQSDLNQLTQYITHFLTTVALKENSKGGVGLSVSRVNDYKTLLKLMQSYEGKTPILIKNINIEFRNKFLKWMTETKNYSKGYAGRMLGNLKTVCSDAEVNGIETHLQLKKVSGFKVKNDFVIYLTPVELTKIEKTKLDAPYLQNARKWLLLGCNIGQRGSDLLNLNDNNIVYRSGLKVIELVQEKTNKSVTIPVLPETEKIIKDGLPHKISLQKFNDYIKVVCEKAKINNVIEGKKLDPEINRHKTGKFKKWELVTSHICRRSFATNLYGILPTPLIMQITAHSKESTFYGYIGKNSFDYAQQIADFYAKLAVKTTHEPELQVIKNVSNK